MGLDVLSCPRCDGRLRLIAVIDDPVVMERILRHLGLPAAIPEARPARSPPMTLLGGSIPRGSPADRVYDDDEPACRPPSWGQLSRCVYCQHRRA